MSKYIDAEKLKGFVGELKKRAQRNCYDTWGIVPDALEEVEGFIETLQQDQPEVELEKEITPSLVENMLCEFGVQSIDDMDSENLAEFARHFAEWGAIHLNARKV